MTRWIIRHNDREIGQASSWHKAINILIKQMECDTFQATFISREFVMVMLIGHEGRFNIKREGIE